MGSNLALSLQRIFNQFYRNQSGAGTVMSLFGLMICLLLGGVAIDSTNAWRNKELLSLTADVAAHAGAVAIAQGADPEDIMDAVMTATEFNMPKDRFGRIIKEAQYDITLQNYDPGTNTFQSTGEPNAVEVTLRRNKLVNNPVPTFLLGLIGQYSWDITARSVATVGNTERCDASEGLFSSNKIVLDGENQIGNNFCIHSQQSVVLNSRNIFEKGSLVSMPDLTNCFDMCNSESNPGIRAQEVNLIMPDLGTFIQETENAFNGHPLTDKAISFFDTKPLSDSLSSLEEVGVTNQDLANPEKGMAVSLAKEQFLYLREYPQGLVYLVECTDQEPLLEIGTEPYAPEMKNIALITNCAIRFGENASIRGSLIVTTSEQPEATITVDQGASAGDPLNNCDPKQHSVIMSFGKVDIPASFARSNVTFVIAGDVQMSGTPGVELSMHRGTAIHASGSIELSSQHNFQPCTNSADILLPTLRILRHVSPSKVARVNAGGLVIEETQGQDE